MPSPKILVIPGSTRTGSHNVRLAALAAKELTLADADVTRISLVDYPLPIYDADYDANSGGHRQRGQAQADDARRITACSSPARNTTARCRRCSRTRSTGFRACASAAIRPMRRSRAASSRSRRPRRKRWRLARVDGAAADSRAGMRRAGDSRAGGGSAGRSGFRRLWIICRMPASPISCGLSSQAGRHGADDDVRHDVNPPRTAA